MPRPAFDRLRHRLARLEAPGRGRAVSLGDPALDRALPSGGFPRSGLHEIVGDAAAGGFALAVASRIAGRDCHLLHVAVRYGGQAAGPLYAPGLVRFGIDLDRLIVASVRRPADLLWTMEEGLRSRALAAVIGEGVTADLIASHRLQLAAEAGGTAALLLPPVAARSGPALTRWRVAAAPSPPDGPCCPRWRIALERCRGGSPADWSVEWDDEDERLRVVPPEADRSPRPLIDENPE